MDRIVVIGCGDIGRRIALHVKRSGAEVFALSRSETSAGKLADIGITSVPGNLDEGETLSSLPLSKATLFYLAPPPGGGNLDSRMRAFCDSVPPGREPEQVVYMSTSAVYGDCGDRLVTEETPPNPGNARGKRRLDAENVLLAWGRGRGVKVVILRVTGIYGPGRLPVTQLASGHPVLEERLAPMTNRIHADDLVNVCLAAADKGEDGDIFNVSDGNSSTMTSYFNAVADILGFPRPRQIGMEEARRVMTPLMLSYIAESRRMDNSKMLAKLGIRLLYPTLEEGLKASLGERL